MPISPENKNSADSAPLTPSEELALPREWSFLHGTDESALPAGGIASIAEALKELDYSPRLPNTDAMALNQSDLIELAIQTWRLDKRVQSMDPNADKRAFKQFSDSVRRFNKLLQRFSVDYEDPIHKPYTNGWLEVEVVNWEEPDDTPSPVAAGPWIKQTIAPIIRREDRMIKAGQVVCVDVPDL